MTPVWALMLRPAGSVAEYVSVSPAAGAVKWLIEREGLPLVGALVGDRGVGRAAVADGELEGLADRHAVGVSGGDGDRVGAVVAVGRGSGDDAGLGVDAQAGRQCGGVCQRIAGGRSGEVAGDVEREGLTLVGALVGDRGRGRAAVADGELEGLADRHAVGVSGGDGDGLAGMNIRDCERTCLFVQIIFGVQRF